MQPYRFAAIILLFCVSISLISGFEFDSDTNDLYSSMQLFDVSSSSTLNNSSSSSTGNSTSTAIIDCARGFTGISCSECASGYYREGTANCRSCGASKSDKIELTLMIVAASIYFISIAVLITRLRDRTLGCTVGWIAFIQQISAVINNGASTINTGTGVFADFLALIVRILSIVNFNIQFLKPGCTIATFSFVSVYFFTILFFLLTAVFFLLAAWVYSRRLSEDQLTGKTRNYIFQNRGKHSLLILGCLCYLQFCLRSFQALVCRSMGDASGLYLVVDPGTRCFSSKHIAVLVFIIIVFPVYAIYYPFWCFNILRQLWRPYLKQRQEQKKKEAHLQLELGSFAANSTNTTTELTNLHSGPTNNNTDVILSSEPALQRRAQLTDFSYDQLDEDLIDCEEELERVEMERIWIEALETGKRVEGAYREIEDSTNHNDQSGLEESKQYDLDANHSAMEIEMEPISSRNSQSISIMNEESKNPFESKEDNLSSIESFQEQEVKNDEFDFLTTSRKSNIRNQMSSALSSDFAKLTALEHAIHKNDDKSMRMDIDEKLETQNELKKDNQMLQQVRETMLKKLHHMDMEENETSQESIKLGNNDNNNINKSNSTVPDSSIGINSSVSPSSSNLSQLQSQQSLLEKTDSGNNNSSSDDNGGNEDSNALDTETSESSHLTMTKPLTVTIFEHAPSITKVKPVEIPANVDYANVTDVEPISMILRTSDGTFELNSEDTIAHLNGLHDFKEQLKANLASSQKFSSEIEPRINLSNSTQTAFKFDVTRPTRETNVEKFAYLYRGTRPSVYWFRNLDFLTNFTLALQISLSHNAALQLFFAGLIFTTYFLCSGVLWPYKSTFENYTAMLRGLSNTFQICFYILFVPGSTEVNYFFFSITILTILIAFAIIASIRVTRLREKIIRFLKTKPGGGPVAQAIYMLGNVTPTNITTQAIEKRNSIEERRKSGLLRNRESSSNLNIN